MKRIIKLDHEVKNIAKEALLTMTKATELFVGYLALRVNQSVQKRGTKTIRDNDILMEIHRLPNMEFLRLEFPQRDIKPLKAKANTNVTAPIREAPSASIKTFFSNATPSDSQSRPPQSKSTPQSLPEPQPYPKPQQQQKQLPKKIDFAQFALQGEVREASPGLPEVEQANTTSGEGDAQMEADGDDGDDRVIPEEGLQDSTEGGADEAAMSMDAPQGKAGSEPWEG